MEDGMGKGGKKEWVEERGESKKKSSYFGQSAVGYSLH